jgi:hypothetical protein
MVIALDCSFTLAMGLPAIPVYFASSFINKSKLEKLDLTKKYKTYFTAKTRPEIVKIEPAQFLSLTGKGDPSAKRTESL